MIIPQKYIITLVGRNMTKKVVCYARFSSSKQREESITIQLEKIMEYCRIHNLEVIGQYNEEAQGRNQRDLPPPFFPPQPLPLA